MNEKSARDRLRYAKRFAHVLETENAQELLQISPEKRIHAMKSLAALSRFLGAYDIWLQIRQRYNLKWSVEGQSLRSFELLFSDEAKTLDKMIQWLRHAMDSLPQPHSDTLLFCTLTGLRSSESIASIRLIKDPEHLKTYYNEERQTLEHFRFPQIFIRRTKTAYMSIVDKQVLEIAQKIEKAPRYDAIRVQSERKCSSFVYDDGGSGIGGRGGGMHMGYCRKIFASWLRQSGIEVELIDLLQGRVGKSIFLRHYYRPNLSSYRDKVLESVQNLRKEIES
jgi:hypothetical protein